MTQKFKLKKRGASAPLSICTVPMQEGTAKNPWLPADREMVVQLVRHMLREGAESMSANQVGGTGRVFCTNIQGDVLRIFCNPEIDIIDYDQELVEETCASFPKRKVMRYRHRHLIVTAKSFAGNPFFLDTSNPMYPDKVSKKLSYLIQHEMEHLNGLSVHHEPDDYQAADPEMVRVAAQPAVYID